MRRLIAVVVVGIALFGAVYLGSLSLGNNPVFLCINNGFGPTFSSVCPTPPPPPHFREGWQIPVSILIGALGVAVGLVVLRNRPKQQPVNSAQAA